MYNNNTNKEQLIMKHFPQIYNEYKVQQHDREHQTMSHITCALHLSLIIYHCIIEYEMGRRLLISLAPQIIIELFPLHWLFSLKTNSL